MDESWHFYGIYPLLISLLIQMHLCKHCQWSWMILEIIQKGGNGKENMTGNDSLSNWQIYNLNASHVSS